jgi:hypothetical protein
MMHITRAAAADTPVRLWLVSDKTQVVIWVWNSNRYHPSPPTLAATPSTASA